jgi:hypothetical protein
MEPVRRGGRFGFVFARFWFLNPGAGRDRAYASGSSRRQRPVNSGIRVVSADTKAAGTSIVRHFGFELKPKHPDGQCCG